MTSWIRTSLRRKGHQPFGGPDRDSGPEYSGRIIAETFERHWHQLRGIAAHNVMVILPRPQAKPIGLKVKDFLLSLTTLRNFVVCL